MPYGGEPPLLPPRVQTFFTDSGRSSLRLILENGFRNKRFLLPNFLCPVIVSVLNEYNVQFDTYPISNTLIPLWEGVDMSTIDVVYVIRYFGTTEMIFPSLREDQWLIEDCVFLPFFEKETTHPNWIGFNSFRKSTALPEGSRIQSTQSLDTQKQLTTNAPFVQHKRQAQYLKDRFLREGIGEEAEYLKFFKFGEMQLTQQEGIHRIGDQTIEELTQFAIQYEGEKNVRQNQKRLIELRLPENVIPLVVDYPTVVPLRVQHRDQLRARLADKGFYLPIHWAGGVDWGHSLFDEIISIPLSSRYNDQQIEWLISAIKQGWE